jgi:hypothetical protein
VREFRDNLHATDTVLSKDIQNNGTPRRVFEHNVGDDEPALARLCDTSWLKKVVVPRGLLPGPTTPSEGIREPRFIRGLFLGESD